MTIKVPCSFEQGEMIADHHMYGGPVVVLDPERARLVQLFRESHPDQKIVGAELDVETCEWWVSLEPR